MKLFLLLFGIGAIVLLLNCHSSKNMATLNDVEWKLEKLNGQELELSMPDSEMFIQFDNKENRVAGRAACNRFFGNCSIDGDKLKFSTMGSTRMTCPDIQKESEFFKMLEIVDSYLIDDNKLFFNSQGMVVAAFKKKVKN